LAVVTVLRHMSRRQEDACSSHGSLPGFDHPERKTRRVW